MIRMEMCVYATAKILFGFGMFHTVHQTKMHTHAVNYQTQFDKCVYVHSTLVQFPDDGHRGRRDMKEINNVCLSMFSGT